MFHVVIKGGRKDFSYLINCIRVSIWNPEIVEHTNWAGFIFVIKLKILDLVLITTAEYFLVDPNSV